jgi:hypothetical protein
MRLLLIESMSPDSPDHSNDRVDSLLWMVWSKIESFASPNICFRRLFTDSKWTSGPNVIQKNLSASLRATPKFKKKIVRLSDPVSGKINISRDVIFHEYEKDLSSSIARSTDFSDFNCANDASVPSGGDGVSVNELSYVELPRKQRHPLHTLINRQVHYLLLV